MSERVGQQFGNYRLLRLLGEGGFAEVYLGEHIHLAMQAAVKILHTKLVQRDQESFLREARTISELEHPAIIKVLDCSIQDGIPYLVMNYAPHGTLRQRHPRESILPIETIIAYIKQIASALQYAHERKFIHRDVKPENMLVGRDQEILLSDFGIALVSSSSSSQSTKMTAGTASYMAPEQIMGKPQFASDQYALGIVTYEWLCGDYPFHGGFVELCAQHLYAPVPPFSNHPHVLIPEKVEAVVMKALAKDATQRYNSIQAFADALAESYQEALADPLSAPKELSSSPTTGNTPTFIMLRDKKLTWEGEGDESETLISDANTPTQRKERNDEQGQRNSTVLVTTASTQKNTDETELIRQYNEHEETNSTIHGIDQEIKLDMTQFAEEKLITTPSMNTDDPKIIIDPFSHQLESTRDAHRTTILPPTKNHPGNKKKRSGVLIACLSILLLLLLLGTFSFASNLISSAKQKNNGTIANSARTTPEASKQADQSHQTPTSQSHTVSNIQKITTPTVVTPETTPTTSIPTTGPLPVQRQLTSTQAQSLIANASGQGTNPATNASGILTFCNSDFSQLGVQKGMIWTNNGGTVHVIVDQDEIIPANPDGSGSTYCAVTGPAHVQEAGVIGNIPIKEIYGFIGNHGHLENDSPFSGGKNASTYPIVRQRDIDGAAGSLKATTQQIAIRNLNSQLGANEHMVGAPQCTSSVSANHTAGDSASTVIVGVQTTCSVTAST